MRLAGRDVGEERLVALLADPVDGVVEDRLVEPVLLVTVAGVLAQCAGVDDRFDDGPVVVDGNRRVVVGVRDAVPPVEPVVHGMVGRVRRRITQVPLAEVAGRVSRRLQVLRQQGLLLRHALRLQRVQHVGHVHPRRPGAGEQRRARRRAQRAPGVVLREPHAAPADAVDVRRVQVRGAVAGEVTVPLVVAHDEHEVRLGAHAAAPPARSAASALTLARTASSWAAVPPRPRGDTRRG